MGVAISSPQPSKAFAYAPTPNTSLATHGGVELPVRPTTTRTPSTQPSAHTGTDDPKPNQCQKGSQPVQGTQIWHPAVWRRSSRQGISKKSGARKAVSPASSLRGSTLSGPNPPDSNQLGRASTKART